MKKSPYLCKTKNKWRVRLAAQDDWLFGQKTEVRILYTLQKYGPFVYWTRKRNRRSTKRLQGGLREGANPLKS